MITLLEVGLVYFFANLYSTFDLYHYANIFIRVCISKHGCTSSGTNLCIY